MLGHHFSLSAEREKGAHYLQAAGDRARMIYANDDALRFYEQALAALGRGRADAAADWQLASALPICAARRAAARSRTTTTRRCCRHIAKPATVSPSARILRKIGRLLWDAGKRDKAEARYAEAAALLDGADAPIEQAHLWQERGRLAFRSGRSRPGRKMGRRGARLRTLAATGA